MSVEEAEKHFEKAGEITGVKGDGRGYSPFLDESISAEQKKAWRARGGRQGGREPQYVTGLKIDDIEDPRDIFRQYLELLANAKQLRRSPSAINSIRAILKDLIELLLLIYTREELEPLLKDLKSEIGDMRAG